MPNQKVFVGATLVVAVVLMMTSVVALLSSRTVENSGEIIAVNVRVYQDSNCMVPLTAWAWGPMEPGSSAMKTMYIKNEGTTTMTLNMTTTNWTTGTSSYIPVTWNREGTRVNAGSNVQANVTLSVLSNITGVTSFSFTMIITGTG